MKTRFTTWTAAVLLAISTTAMAANGPDNNLNLATANLAVDTYLDVMTEGQTAHLEQLFTADFNQKIQGKTNRTHQRAEVIKFLKKQKGERLDCSTSAEIIESNADYAVAKIIMQFDGFSKIDYITLVKEENLWKISSSVHSYQG